MELIKRIKIFYHHWMAIAFENHTDHIAIKHVKKLAELDDSWGLHDLGYRYANGISVNHDREKAIFYYKRAFEKKNEEAKYSAANLGLIYLNGYGVPKSGTKATVWFKKAAELGHPESQYNYGLSLIDGWGDVINKTEGLYWLKLAAKSNLPEAKEVLTRLDEKI